MSNGTSPAASGAEGQLAIRDTRTGSEYAASIRTEGPEGDTYVRATDLRAIKRDAGEFGLLSYDPAFMNTASCRSAITYIDGDKGILRYRGYPIEQLAEKATFLEVSYLLRHGELPTQSQYDTSPGLPPHTGGYGWPTAAVFRAARPVPAPAETLIPGLPGPLQSSP